MRQAKSGFLSFRTTEDVKKMLDDLSEKHERSLSDVIHLLLKSFIDNIPKQLPIPLNKKENK